MKTVRTPWIYSPKFDGAAIIGPPVAVTLLVLLFGHQIARMDEPIWLWIVLVLGIDVAHVYSSLFRTYLDKEEFAKRRTQYLIIPAASWLIGVAIYFAAGPVIFWSCVAYFAIYHFVRQQYGFFMLYRRGEPSRGLEYRLDQLAIYITTIYPLVYWHTYPRAFQWFEGFEVLRIPTVWPELICRAVYIVSLSAFVIKEFLKPQFNVGKVALLVATAAAWGTGIILFNGDLTFTLINIVSHGVPYIALVWIYQYRKAQRGAAIGNPFLKFFRLKYVPIYVAALVALAYFEEGIWDWFVWKEHASLFGSTYIQLSPLWLGLLIPLLTMPQVTHYVLDGFIWRVNRNSGTEVRAVID